MEGVETVYPLTSSKQPPAKDEKKPKEKPIVPVEKKRTKAGWLAAIVLLLLLLFALGAGMWLVRRQTVFYGRASSPSVDRGEPVLANSYLFASPLRAAAGGQEMVRVTVFVLDDQGRGVEGKLVELGQAAGLEVAAVQAQTDYLGRALFDLAGSAAGEYHVEAAVEGQVLPQRVKVSFR